MKRSSSFVAARLSPVCLFAISACMLLASSSDAVAQNQSHWGIGVSFVPNWVIPTEAGELLFEYDTISVEGSEFRIGVIRGRDLSGDWGVSFVHKRISDGSFLDGRSTQCFGSFGCGTTGTRYVYQDVTLRGIEIHKFVPFVTIKRRAQVGMTFAGGVAQFKGLAKEETYYPFATGPTGTILVAGDYPPTVGDIPAQDLFVLRPVPLGRIEISVAGILAPGIKIRAGGGLNMPGIERFTLTASYLFGAR